MTKHDLVREELIIPDTPAELLGEPGIWEQAEKMLRYQGGQLATTALQHRTNFRTLLKQVGVKPFTAASVARYQRVQRRKMWWRANWRLCLGATVPTVMLTTIAVWLTSLMGGLPLGGGLVGAVVGGAISIALMANIRWTRFRWQKIPLREYAEPIPAAAIEMALMLHAQRPTGMGFLIEVLLQERAVTRTYPPDPFLIVRDAASNSEAYIAVWDEPSFKADVA